MPVLLNLIIVALCVLSGLLLLLLRVRLPRQAKPRSLAQIKAGAHMPSYVIMDVLDLERHLERHLARPRPSPSASYRKPLATGELQARVEGRLEQRGTLALLRAAATMVPSALWTHGTLMVYNCSDVSVRFKLPICNRLITAVMLDLAAPLSISVVRKPLGRASSAR